MDTQETDDFTNDGLYQLEYSRDRVLQQALPEHHYVFIHKTMRDACQTIPDVFFNAMASDAREEFLETAWEMTCEQSDQSRPPYFSASDIEIHLLRLNDFPAVVMIMPEPLRSPEAFMAAAVLLESDDSAIDNVRRESHVAYITLERGIGANGTLMPYLCAWNGDVHVNLGVFDEIDPLSFCKAAEELLANRQDEFVGIKSARIWSRFRRNMLKSIGTPGITGNA